MKISNAYKRLFSLYGLIDKQHNILISTKIKGTKVLDVGCGYGALVCHLTHMGINAIGIDCDIKSIQVGKKIFPKVNIKYFHAEKLNIYNSELFDTIVLKDCIHHLIEEYDINTIFNNFKKILKKGGRIIIFDPNPTWILLLSRLIISHKDPKTSLDVALKLLQNEGFMIKGVDFFETIGIALSGGFVGIRLIPNIFSLNSLFAYINEILSKLLNFLHLGRFFCWRYLVYADKKISDECHYTHY